MKANYHTHTRWCHHGNGEIEDYILQAMEVGLEELAITEHVPLLGDPDSWRMQCSEFAAFDEELNRQIEKYRGKIKVLKGFECEYYPEMLDSYRRFRDEYGYHLLILGQHRSMDGVLDNFALSRPEEIVRYADEVCEGLSTGLFTFLCHPDVIMAGYKRYDDTIMAAMRQIFALCEKLRIPVEINANGEHYRRGYPCRKAWEDAGSYDLDCLINSDAHEVADIFTPSVTKCETIATELGLRVLERVPQCIQ